MGTQYTIEYSIEEKIGDKGETILFVIMITSSLMFMYASLEQINDMWVSMFYFYYFVINCLGRIITSLAFYSNRFRCKFISGGGFFFLVLKKNNSVKNKK